MAWNITCWSQRDYRLLLSELQGLADESYRVFHQRLITDRSTVLGVRMPQLRRLAKEIAGGGGETLFPFLRENVYEEMMLYGLVLGYQKSAFSVLLTRLEDFIPKIDNWAVCDCSVTGLIAVKKERERFFGFLQPYLVSTNEFSVRFAVVSLMTYYTDALWVDRVLSIYRCVEHPGYYVKMAVAWAVAEAYVKEKEKATELLKECCLDRETQNKAIQKIRDSYRVTAADKDVVKQYRL